MSAEAGAAEVLWASSEQGKAAVGAGWERALRLGLGRGGPMLWDIADISAIVYAAYLAAGWDAEPVEDEPAPAHLHTWAMPGIGPHTPCTTFATSCSRCGERGTWTLPGDWTLETLTGGTDEH